MRVLLEFEHRSRLSDVTRSLVDTAMGRIKADLVVQNASIVNVNSGEIQEHQDIAVKGDRIALIGKAGGTIGPNTKVIDARGNYLVPGFIDGHVHVESAMVTGTEFANAVLPHGTTTVFIDPHEITNVLGLYGVRFFLNEAIRLPLKILITFPSCVPAAPGFETNGASIGPSDVAEAMTWKGVAALGEVMNYHGVLASDENVHNAIAETIRVGKVVEGHAVDLLDQDLAAYAAAGITSCHESTTKGQAAQKLRNGMYAMLREGSAASNIADTILAITEDKLDSRHACLVTDDREPSSLLREGQIDHAIRKAIQEGLDPIHAIQMATLNTAEHFECARELGSIAPARFADLVILTKLESVDIESVIADGSLVSHKGKMMIDLPRPKFPERARNSIHLKHVATLDDLRIITEMKEGSVRAWAIGVQPTNVFTRKLEVTVPVRDSQALPNPDDDVAKIAVFERHKATGNVAAGFIKGLGLRDGAVASTVGHDSHNLVAAGVDDDDILFAINAIIKIGGGMVVVKNQRTTAEVPLPIAGLMSDKPIGTVAGEVENLKRAWSDLGSTLPSPHITLAFTTLSVIPELRITDKGVLDTVQFKFLNPIIE